MLASFLKALSPTSLSGAKMPEKSASTTILAEQPDPSLNSSPFEGPEKLLEIWFAASAKELESADDAGGKIGLRRVERKVWEEMLDIVQCKVLSVIEGSEMDAYLLSESSFFVSPHKLILKTCGTTLNLLGLPRILSIAKEHCGLNSVWRCFYSRKSFMFPELQHGPHREWKEEVGYLDNLFPNRGSAYTVGRMNGDHWLLYMTSPVEDIGENDPGGKEDDRGVAASDLLSSPALSDFTIEILMSRLAAPARRSFFFPSDASTPAPQHHARGAALSNELGIDALFPPSLTTLDAFAFEPCGYSSNALVNWGGGEGYYTIHVTPEEGWSYASFECNVPLRRAGASTETSEDDHLPDLETLIQKVVQIFQPGHLSLTLFVSSSSETSSTPVDIAQVAFKEALTPRGYKRTDKINYEFDGYDLAFASFEKPARGQHP